MLQAKEAVKSLTLTPAASRWRARPIQLAIDCFAVRRGAIAFQLN